MVLSVTVPHVLPMDEQQQLAVDLVDAGADLIQTEGGTSAKPFSAGTLGLIEKAAPTLAAAHSIVLLCSKPVWTPRSLRFRPLCRHPADGDCRWGRRCGRGLCCEPPQR